MTLRCHLDAKTSLLRPLRAIPSAFARIRDLSSLASTGIPMKVNCWCRYTTFVSEKRLFLPSTPSPHPCHRGERHPHEEPLRYGWQSSDVQTCCSVRKVHQKKCCDGPNRKTTSLTNSTKLPFTYLILSSCSQLYNNNFPPSPLKTPTVSPFLFPFFLLLLCFFFLL